MFFDKEYGYIELEQCARPGSIGDSLAETSRYITLMYLLDIPYNSIDLSNFITDKGILRHPDSPWRENDTSGDQIYPLIAASSLIHPEITDMVIEQIKHNRYKTGNGDFISPGMFTQIRRAEHKHFLFVSDLFLLAQAIILKLPFRWSDSKKSFESSKNSSGDYLNFINGLAFAKAKNNTTFPLKLAKKLIKKDTLKQKVQDYYKIEPNSQWIINIYNNTIDRIYDV